MQSAVLFFNLIAGYNIGSSILRQTELSQPLSLIDFCLCAVFFWFFFFFHSLVTSLSHSSNSRGCLVFSVTCSWQPQKRRV